MNKEIKRVSEVLAERKAERDEVIAKARADLKATSDTLTSLRASLENADGAEQYKTILHDIKDNEAVLEFCEKRLHEAENTALSDAEYSDVINEVRTAFKAIKDEHAKVINSAIDKLLKLLEVYDNEVSELNDIVDRAGELHKSSFNETISNKVNPRAIADDVRNPLHPYRLYVEDFYKIKNARSVNAL